VEVELEELWGADRRTDLLNADGAQGRNTEHRAELLGSFGDGPFAIVMEKPLQCGRRAEQWHIQFLPHNTCRHVDVFDACEDVGYEITAFEGFGISPISDLIIRRPIDVMEDWARQSSPCHQTKILDVVASIGAHGLLHLTMMASTMAGRGIEAVAPLMRRSRRRNQT
jgi:hypothetical protein